MSRQTGRKWALVAGGCVLFLSPLLAYAAIALDGGNTFLFEDGLLYSFPLRVFIHNAFTQGFSPQWVPYSACGFSLLAEGQSSLCFPATQIFYRLFPAETGWLVELVAGHLLALLCCGLLLRHLGLGPLPALFGGSVYAFSAVALFRSNVPSMMWCYALLPALLWAAARFMEGRPRAALSLLIVVALVLLTGHPVLIVYMGLVTLAFVVYLAVHLWPREKDLWRAGTRPLVLVAVVAGAALVALPQLLPSLQQLGFSARTTAATSSVDVLQNTLHLNFSWIPASLFPTPFDSTDYRTYWSIEIRFPVYVLFLVLVGLGPGIRGRHRWYFVALALFALLMALGPRVGLWKLVHSFPVLKHFRFPFRWLFFVPLCVSVLAAFGLDRLLQRTDAVSSPLQRWILRSLLLAVLAAELVVILARRDIFVAAALDAWRSRPWLSSVLWLSAAGMVLAAFLVTRRSAGLRPVVLGVSLTVISLFATRAFCLYDPGVVRDLAALGRQWDTLPVVPQPYRVSTGLRPYAVWRSNHIERHYRQTPNLSLLAGRLHTGHYCSFIPYWAADVSSWCRGTLSGLQAHEKILDLCSARWLVDPNGTPSEPTLRKTELAPGMAERENPGAVPRAHIALSSVFCADDDALLPVLESAGFEPRQTVALFTKDKSACDPPPAADTAPDPPASPSADILVDRPDRVEIALEPAAPPRSLLVLSDTYYPGWKVFVDGVERNILRANYAFRGVPLPAGAKRVVFAFEPLIPDAVLALPAMILIVLGLALVLPVRPGPERKGGQG